MKKIKVISGIIIIFLQIPAWLLLTSENNPVSTILGKYLFLVLVPIAGLGIALFISGAKPASPEKK